MSVVRFYLWPPLDHFITMFTVYVLINEQGKIYIGFSANFEQRLIEHNNLHGKKRGWSRTKGPWKLLYKEEFSNKTEALKREKELKNGKGRDFIHSLILKTRDHGSPPRRTMN